MKNWPSIVSFFSCYLSAEVFDCSFDPNIGINDVEMAMTLADWIIQNEPELAPYVLQVLLEGD